MKLHYIFLLVSALFLASCNDDDNISVGFEEPATYSFNRNGESTVSFGGQSDRIAMAEELISEFKNFDGATEQKLLNMFTNTDNPFSNADLNASSKNIKSKTAASKDYFASNTAEAATIKQDFENWISAQVNEVFPAQNTEASQGVAGQIADGTSTRYVSAKGLEYNQAFAKSLIGALMTDQALNNYLSPIVLDESTNVADNDAGTVAEGKNYTTMEHKWDEAYGYIYGASQDKANPNATIGSDDSFLNKYIGKVNGDEDFAGIADNIFNAFKKGRAAIVAKQYDVRDQQAAIIRENVSKAIGVRAVHYLQAGKTASEMGGKFHDLSEGFGFVYSLQFTRVPNTNQPYFTNVEVDQMLSELMANGGFWTVSDETIDSISEEIANKFGFSVSEAAN